VSPKPNNDEKEKMVERGGPVLSLGTENRQVIRPQRRQSSQRYPHQSKSHGDSAGPCRFRITRKSGFTKTGTFLGIGPNKRRLQHPAHPGSVQRSVRTQLRTGSGGSRHRPVRVPAAPASAPARSHASRRKSPPRNWSPTWDAGRRCGRRPAATDFPGG
jgi:hypothetical protein